MPVGSRQRGQLIKLAGNVTFPTSGAGQYDLPFFSMEDGRSRNQMPRLDCGVVQNMALGIAQLKGLIGLIGTFRLDLQVPCLWTCDGSRCQRRDQRFGGWGSCRGSVNVGRWAVRRSRTVCIVFRHSCI